MKEFKRSLKQLAYRTWRKASKRPLEHATKDLSAKYTKRMKALRRDLESFRVTALYLPRYQHDSLTPGIPEWDHKWQTSERRVVLLATQDYGGSFFQWARAINAHTDWAARLVVVLPHRYGYSNDLVLGAPEGMGDAFRSLLKDSDVVHIKDESGFMTGANRFDRDFLTTLDRPTVTTLYGSQARRRQNDLGFRAHVNSFSASISLTPDLCFDWLDHPYYVPAAVDLSDIPTTWDDAQVVAHAPSNPALKGTALFEAAVQGLGVDVDIITDTNHEQTLARIARAGLFFDQAGVDTQSNQVIGWYGNAALEAASRGVPTIVHLSEVALAGADRGGYPARHDLGLINTRRTVEDLHARITYYLEQDTDSRVAQSQATREWVRRFHDAETVGGRLRDLYASLLT